MKPNKFIAAAAAAAVAAGGLASIALATSASATGTATAVVLTGSPSNQAGTASYVATPDIGITATQSGTNVNVHVTVSQGPKTTAFAGFAANSYRLDAFVRMDGVATDRGSALAIGTVGTAAVPTSTVSYPSGTSMDATFTSVPAGSHTFTVTDLVADSSDLGTGAGSSGQFGTALQGQAGKMGFDAWYNKGADTQAVTRSTVAVLPTGGTTTNTPDPTTPYTWDGAAEIAHPYVQIGVSDTITVAGVATASVSSISNQLASNTTKAHAADVVTLTGSSFDPSVTPTVTIGGVAASASTLATDGSGNLTGTATIASGAAIGAGSIVVTTPNKSATIPLTVLAAPAITATPQTGGVGTSVTITGTNFNPGLFGVAQASIPNTGGSYYGLADGTNGGCTNVSHASPCIATGPYISGANNAKVAFTPDANGGFTATVVVSDPLTTQIQASQKTVTAGAATNTTVDMSALASGLSKTAPAQDGSGAASTAHPSFVVAQTATVATSTAQADGTQYVARNGFARTITLTGSSFSPSVASGTGTVAFCDTTGANCDTTPGVTNTLTTTSTGTLSGGISVLSTDTLTTGSRAIKLTGLSATAKLIPVHVLANKPVLTLTPSSGLVGTTVTVTGSEFNTGQTGQIYGSTGTVDSGAFDNTTDGLVSFTASNTGTISASYTVTDPTTASIAAVQHNPITGPPAVDQPVGFALFTVTADTTAPTGTASVSPKSGSVGVTSKVTISNIADNAGAAHVTKSVTWGDGSTSAVAAGVATASHKYTKLGAFPVKVTLKDVAGNTSAAISAGTVTVKDTTKPSASLTTPKKPTKGSSWKTIKGKVSDKGGSNAKSVTVKLIEKKSGKWYYFNGKKWVKTTSKSKALSKAKKLTDTSVSSGAWSVKVKAKPGKGTLYVSYTATDKAGNTSKAKTKTQKIKS